MQQQPPAGQPPAQTNPLQQVPNTTPQLEQPKAAPTTPQLLPGQQIIDSIDIKGARRVPVEQLKATLSEKSGDIYDEDQTRRDFMQLWNSGRFQDIRVETEAGERPNSVKLTFVVTERRVIRTIHYEGLHTVTESELLDRFKERKVGLTVESQYDPNKIQHAAIVLKEYLAERGRQYATVDPQIEQIPPSSLQLTFRINEGPKVKVGEIETTGNKAFTRKWVVSNMKDLKPYGIPYSIYFENLFAKTYDYEKLQDDKEHIRQAYNDHGYFNAKILDEKVQIVPKGGRGWRLPLVKMNTPGIFADITLPIEEGRQFHLHSLKFEGVTVFRAPEALGRAWFGMAPGDVFSTDRLRKGLKKMTETYNSLGYIDFTPEPNFEPIPDTDQMDLTITADEGKRFFIRRIDFTGNTTTRDKVIRREILLDEGDIFNSQLWDVSVLRLNQLGYFEVLKKEDAADIKKNIGSDTVDITLKVRERGKNSIGLNGGVSGIAGSFVGFNYSTNNFLGLGETLSLNSQLGTRQRVVSFSFTEPYFLDKPVQTGFTIYLNRFDFNQGREASILAGQNLIPLYNQLGTQNLLNYVQNSHGFNVFGSYQLHHSFWRTRHHLRLRYLEHRDADHRRYELLPVHQLQRRLRAECARGHQDQHHDAVGFLQYRQPSHQPDRRSQHLLQRGLRRQRPGRQRQHDAPRGRPQILPSFAHQEDSRSGVPLVHVHHHRLRRQRDPALLPHLHRRRAGRARFRNLGHHAHRVYRLQRFGERAQQRWFRAHAEAGERRRDHICPCDYGSAHVPIDHARRRLAIGGQLRIPHTDCWTGHAGGIRRRRVEPHSTAQPVGHEPDSRRRFEPAISPSRIQRQGSDRPRHGEAARLHRA